MAKPASSDKAKRAGADKARRPDEDKLAAAIRDDDGRSYTTTPVDNGRRAICFNRACPDYRRERPASQSCGCKRTTVDAK